MNTDYPFRYRGYVYGIETGLYYLRYRYNNPNWQRFVNADATINVETALYGANQFAYCINNPINTKDSTGKWFMFIAAAIGAVVGAVVGGCVAAANGDSVLEGALIGAAIGGVVGLGAGAIASVVTTGTITASSTAVVSSVTGSATTTGVASLGTGATTVYISRSVDKVVHYIGITNNFARRALEHLAQKGIHIEELITDMSRYDARAVEQCLIEYYQLEKNGGTLINKINSISPNNPIYSESVRRGWEILNKLGILYEPSE